MDNGKSMHRVSKKLCLFVVILLMMMLILNLIPIGGEWASVAREWIENAIGLN